MLAALCFCVAMVMQACSEAPRTDPPSSTATDEQAAIMQPADPSELVFVFQRQADPNKIRASADTVAARLTEALGIPVKVYIPTDYSASVQALVSGQADFAYVSSVPFLLAQRDANASIVLVEEREDAQGTPRTEYDSVIVVRDDSPLMSMSDVKADASRLNFVFTSPTSTSGYIFAYMRLVRDGVLSAKQDPRTVFARATYGGSYTQALHQVLDGRGDLCAVSYYTVEGPTADVYLSAEERGQLRILTRTSGVPTHLICVRGGISDSLTSRVRQAMLELAADEPELLAQVYGAKRFVAIEDENAHIAPLLEALRYLDMDVSSFVN